MNHTWVSILPFLVVIPIAIWLKEILPALVLGLLVGAFLDHHSLLGGFRTALNDILKTLTTVENIQILGFLYLFGGFVGMMQISGGIKGLVEWVGQRIKSDRTVLLLIWITLPITFFSPMFRIMVIGPVMKSILGNVQIAKKRMAFLMDISTEPFIVLLPIATAFVGFMTSVVGGAMKESHLAGTPYRVFLSSLPYNFFAWSGLVLGVLATIRGGGKPADKRAKQKQAGEEKEGNAHRASIEKELTSVKGHVLNFSVPLGFLLLLTLVLLGEDGWTRGAHSIWAAFSKADAVYVMLLSIFITLLATGLFYLLRRVRLPEVMFHFFDGGNQMMTPIVLLILVWAVSAVAEDLGFSSFVASSLGSVLPGWSVPAALFVLGSLVAYFIGTSWGTWGLFMPLAAALCAATGAPFDVTVGAVFASGTFGAFASPVGDTTITTATIMEMELMDYARYKLKAALLCAGICIAGYLVMGFFMG